MGFNALSGLMGESVLTFRLEDEQKIPESAGVYAYLYNPFQLSRLGLYIDRTIGDVEVELAKKTLKRKLKRYTALRGANTLRGVFRAQGPYRNVHKRYHGHLLCQEDDSLWDDLDSLSANEFMAYVSMAENSYAMFQPLYCGMTVDQGLKSRYKQHKGDNENSREGTFGGRLAKFNLSWQDVLYVCVPMSMDGENRASIEALERHLIYLFEPILSVR